MNSKNSKSLHISYSCFFFLRSRANLCFLVQCVVVCLFLPLPTDAHSFPRNQLCSPAISLKKRLHRRACNNAQHPSPRRGRRVQMRIRCFRAAKKPTFIPQPPPETICIIISFLLFLTLLGHLAHSNLYASSFPQRPTAAPLTTLKMAPCTV